MELSLVSDCIRLSDCLMQKWRSLLQMSSKQALQRYLIVISLGILLLTLCGCRNNGGPVKVENIIQPTISIGGLKDIEYKSAIPIKLTIGSSGRLYVTIVLGYRVGSDGDYQPLTALAGRVDPTSLQELFVPAGGTDYIFWWHAIADLDSGELHFPVWVKATITTSDGAVAEVNFGPFRIDYTDAFGGTTPPYVPDLILPSSYCGAPYDVPLPVIGGYPPFEWSLLPEGVQLPYVLELTHDGIIKGQFPLGYGPINIEFTARVIDSNPVIHRESAGQFSIFIDCEEGPPCGPEPEILFASLPNATEGVGYLYQATASGGFPPLTWEITSGDLPDGITFGADGLFEGTPAIGTAGDYSLTIMVSDSCPDGARADAIEVTLNVNTSTSDCDPGPIILTQTIAGAIESEAYDQTLQVEGGHGAVSWTLISGSLPSGVNLTPNGHISGTPGTGTGGTEGESYTFTVQVCDSCDLAPQCDTQELLLLVAPPGSGCDPPPQITSDSMIQGAVGVNYLFIFTAAGGHGNRTWILNNLENLPEGLEFLDTGRVQGIPGPGTEGIHMLDVMVIDSCHDVQSDQKQFDLEIITTPCGPGPEITTSYLFQGFENTPYDLQFEATGGEGTLTWSHIGGDWPMGLTLDPDGRFYGMPQSGTQGTYLLDIQVADSCWNGQQTDSDTFSLDIGSGSCADPPVIETTVLDGAPIGLPYNMVLIATDGEGNLTWEILTDGDPLPLNLSLIGNSIQGTPEPGTEGTYNLHIQVCDECPTPQCDDIFADLTVYPPCATGPTITTMSPLDAVIIGEPYSMQLSAVNGEGILNWSVLLDGDPLPAGLGLVGDQIAGTAEAGTEGNWLLHIEVCDSCPVSQCHNSYLTLPVGTTPCDPGPTITTASIPTAYVGTPYSFQFESTGGDGTLTWRVEDQLTLPLLWVITPTGILEGTATEPMVGSYPFEVIVTDSCWTGGQSDTKGFTLEIELAGCAPPPVITNFPALAIPAGSAVDLQFLADLGEGNLIWSLENISPPLPGTVDLALDGHLLGITDASEFGLYAFDVRVCDECADPAPQCSVLVGFALTLNEASGCTNPPTTIVDVSIPEPIPDGSPYSHFITANDGDPPLMWFGFGFPQGIMIDSATGEVRGSTTETGTFDVYITIFDSCTPTSQADSALYTWTL
jgi:hypothetical protein